MNQNIVKLTFICLAFLCFSYSYSSLAQVIPLASSNVCSPVFSDTVKAMGRPSGLTVFISQGCAFTGWGFDINQGVSFGYDPFSNAPLSVVECETNLDRGYIKMVGTRPITYYEPGPTLSTTTDNLSMQLFIQFTSNGTDPIPLKRNGDIVYSSTASAFQVHFLLQANADDLSNPSWHSANTHSGWSPALDLFDDLRTPVVAGGLVFTELNHDYYKLDTPTFLDVGTIPGVTVTQSPDSLPNTLPGGYNSGLELSAYNGTTGLTYTYTNNSGSDLAVGIDPATGFGYSYHSAAPPPLGNPFYDTGRILYYSETSSDLNNGLSIFTGCTPIRHRMAVSGVVFQTTPSMGVRMEVRFLQGASGTTPKQATWSQGLIYMTIPDGQTARVNFLMLANADDLIATPSWNNAPMSGWVPALTLFDELENEPTGEYSLAHQKLNVRVFDPSAPNTVPSLAWTGNISTAWENPCNWTCRLPTVDDDVVIPASPASGNYPLIANTIVGNCRTIEIQGAPPLNRLTIQTGGTLNVVSP